MRKIGYKAVFSRVRLAVLGTLLGVISFAIIMTILWQAALAAPPIEESPVSMEGPATISSTPQGVIRTVAAADLDGDGHPDMAYGQANLLRIQRNAGITTTEWVPAVTAGSAAYTLRNVHPVDLDRDGAVDLVSASADEVGNSQLSLWQNPTSPFANPWTVSNTLVSSVISLTTVASADLDGNGTPDLVSGGLDGVLRLWSNPLTGTQAFATSWLSLNTISTPGDLVRRVVIADVDRDGLLDIVEVAGGDSSGVVRLWQNPGTPFSTAWTISNTLSTFSAAVQSLSVGDLDNNGTPDVAVGLADGRIVVWSNPITGSQPFTAGWGGSSSVGSLSSSIVGMPITTGNSTLWLRDRTHLRWSHGATRASHSAVGGFRCPSALLQTPSLHSPRPTLIAMATTILSQRPAIPGPIQAACSFGRTF
jgi:hypothetical protein